MTRGSDGKPYLPTLLLLMESHIHRVRSLHIHITYLICTLNMEKYYFAAKSFELHTCMICWLDVFVVSCYLLGLSAWFIFQMSFLMLIKVVNTNVVCLVVRSLAHVCIGGIICYFLFWLALIYVARAAAQ